MKEKIELPAFLRDHRPWDKEGNPIWPASSFTVRRNLGKYIFPSKMDSVQSQQVMQTLQGILLNPSTIPQAVLLKAEELSPLDKSFLAEHFFSPENLQNTFEGQGFIIDATGHLLALINIQDHLQLTLIDSKNEWDKTWAQLVKMETEVGNAIDYAFSPKFGYLTSNPENCGTALTIQTFLHIPALYHSGQLPSALNKEHDDKTAAVGLQGSIADLVGDILILSNHYTLGIAEDTLLQSVHATSMKLMMAEKAARSQLKQSNDPHFKDLVSRAYGLLVHSYQLQTIEALNALSLIKLGVDLGWIIGLTDAQLNDIFFKCQRAHLLHHLKEPSLAQEDITHQRAAFLHEALKPLELKI